MFSDWTLQFQILPFTVRAFFSYLIQTSKLVILRELIPCIDSWRLLLPQELAVAALRRYGRSRFGRVARYWLPFRTRYWWKTGRTLPTLHWFYCCLGDDRMSDVVLMEKRTDRRIRKVRFSVRKMWRERSVKEN